MRNPRCAAIPWDRRRTVEDAADLDAAQTDLVSNFALRETGGRGRVDGLISFGLGVIEGLPSALQAHAVLVGVLNHG